MPNFNLTNFALFSSDCIPKWSAYADLLKLVAHFQATGQFCGRRIAVSWLLNVQATCLCISQMGLLYALSHWERSCRSKLPSLSLWQQIQLSLLISPWHTLAYCWDAKQPRNKSNRTQHHSERESSQTTHSRSPQALRKTEGPAMHCHLHRGDWSFHLTNGKKNTQRKVLQPKALTHSATADREAWQPVFVNGQREWLGSEEATAIPGV